MNTQAQDTQTQHGMTRRRFLRGTGAVTVLVAGGGVWRATNTGVFATGTGPAYEPWHTWRTDRPEGPLGIVHAGILAANPHNTQPWLFRITDERIEVLADTGRNLGTFDPYLREMHLGLGCAVENMVLAADAFGYRPTVTYERGTLTAHETRASRVPVARIDLARGERRTSDLVAAIPDRHTNRGPYDPARPVAPDLLREMQAVTGKDAAVRVLLLTNEREREQFTGLTVDATRAIVADAEMVHDSHAWFRDTWRDAQTHRDGLTLDSVGLPPLMTAAAKMLPPLPAKKGHEIWLQATADVHCASAVGFGLLAVRDLYQVESTLRAGRAWQRLHLWATTRQLAMHPINQMVEMVDRERQLDREATWAPRLETLTGDGAWRPTFAFRFGYAVRDAALSPRRSLTDVAVS